PGAAFNCPPIGRAASIPAAYPVQPGPGNASRVGGRVGVGHRAGLPSTDPATVRFSLTAYASARVPVRRVTFPSRYTQAAASSAFGPRQLVPTATPVEATSRS